MKQRQYIAIDLKSFYASVECVARGLDPLQNHLVVADAERTEKTICLAVSPSLKAYGVPGRARLFEVQQRVREINALRLCRAPRGVFTGKSCYAPDLLKNPGLELDFLIAPPRMGAYLKTSAQIYRIYLRYIAPEDMHIYSIDEVFIDATPYLKTYQMTAPQIAMKMIHEVLKETGITATAGIGTNLYLAKIAMDIEAKHREPDENGVRMAVLDEYSYRERLWEHRPLRDFWRIGRGYERRLAAAGLYTMGDIARCSIGKPMDFYNEELLYGMFGVNAELLIDHAWGYEPCRISEIRNYQPAGKSTGSGQVLSRPYTNKEALLVVREMADTLAMDLMKKGLVTDQLVLGIGYDRENLKDPERMKQYHGALQKDFYGRMVPERAHGSMVLEHKTALSDVITRAAVQLYGEITHRALLVRRIQLTAGRVYSCDDTEQTAEQKQLSFFDCNAEDAAEEKHQEREQRLQETMLAIKEKMGKNAILHGMDLQEAATTVQRNNQIGGHRG